MSVMRLWGVVFLLPKANCSSGEIINRSTKCEWRESIFVPAQNNSKFPEFKSVTSRTWYILPLCYPAGFWYDPFGEDINSITKIDPLNAETERKFVIHLKAVFEYFLFGAYQTNALQISVFYFYWRACPSIQLIKKCHQHWGIPIKNIQNHFGDPI